MDRLVPHYVRRHRLCVRQRVGLPKHQAVADVRIWRDPRLLTD